VVILSLVVSSYLTAQALRSSDDRWLACVALLPLFASIRSFYPGRAMLAGALWGLCLYLFTTGDAATGVREGGLSIALLTAAPAGYALLGSLVTRRIGFNPLVLGVAWMGMEFAFERLDLRQGLLGGTQSGGVLMAWIGGALGYVLVAFVVAFASSVLLMLLSRARVGSSSPRYLAAPDLCDTRLIPQTFSCSPLFAITCSRPRAPPAPAADRNLSTCASPVGGAPYRSGGSRGFVQLQVIRKKKRGANSHESLEEDMPF